MGFRGKLLTLVFVGIFTLVAVISLLTVVVGVSGHEKTTLEQGTRLVSDLSKDVSVPFVFDNKQEVIEYLHNYIGFNNIAQASVYTSDKSVYATVGQSIPCPISFFGSAKSGSAYKEENLWHFVSPIYLGGDPSTLNDHNVLYSQWTPDEKEFVGFAHLTIDVAPSKKLMFAMLASNVVISCVITMILLFFVNLGISRLIQPLYSLSDNMKNKVSAPIQGPKEIAHIASVYNDMMDEISGHHRKLEAEVDMRTRDLVEARDLALSANRSKSEFLANTSHELRTPLQSVIGYTSLVIDELELEARHDLIDSLQIVETDANKLLNLINTILDLAKIESGQMNLNLQETDIKAVVLEATNTVKPLMDYNKNQLVINDTDLPEIPVFIDRELVVQVLTNLLSNAGKFTEEGHITLTATLDQEALIFIVIDTGIGIPEDQQDLIFDAFKQVHRETKKAYRGSGLGLAITKQICDLMGAKIDVSSEVGKGSAFKVQIPLPSPTE